MTLLDFRVSFYYFWAILRNTESSRRLDSHSVQERVQVRQMTSVRDSRADTGDQPALTLCVSRGKANFTWQDFEPLEGFTANSASSLALRNDGLRCVSSEWALGGKIFLAYISPKSGSTCRSRSGSADSMEPLTSSHGNSLESPSDD